MTLEAARELMNSAVWNATAMAMVDFLLAGAIVWIVAVGIRAVLRTAAPTVRYAVACLILSILAVVAAASCARRWPASLEGVPVVRAQPPLALTPDQFTPPQTIGVTSSQIVISTPPQVASLQLWQQRIVPWLPWIWIVGVPWVALFVAMGWIGASRLRGGSHHVEGQPVRDVFHRCATLLNVQGVSLLICDRLVSPVVVGIVRPAVLIPPSLLTSLTLSQWEMILLHELAHVRRLDNLVNLGQRTLETLLYFHPAVWWASRWVRLEREHCCDAVVLEHAGSAQEYAETLAVLALPGLSPQLATAAMANHELLTRMRHILGTEDLTMAMSRRRLLTAAAVFAFAVGVSVTGLHELDGRAQANDEPDSQAAIRWLAKVQAAKGDRPDATQTRANELIAELESLLVAQSEPRSAETIRRLRQLKELLAEEKAPEVRDASKSIDRAIEFLTTRAQKSEWQGSVRKQDSTSPPESQEQSTAILGLQSVLRTTESKRPWSPQQATGAPDVPSPGDNASAWAARQPDVGAEWIRVGFDEPIAAVAVVIHESLNPGALSGVDVGLASDSGGEPETEEVWASGTAVVPGASDKRVSVFPLKSGARKIENVTVHVYEPKVAGWNEIDAIGLVDASTGEVKWATTAEASSSFADRNEPAMIRLQLGIDTSLTARPFTAGQVTGAPNVAEAGDSPNAWASATPDGQEESLELTYDPPVPAAAILIYESFNPGALSQVTVETSPVATTHTIAPSDVQFVGSFLAADLDASGIQQGVGESPAQISFSIGLPREQTIWEGVDPSLERGSGKGVAVIAVPAGLAPISKVRLKFNSAAVPGFNEIDAVGLLRASDGQVQWAQSATASSEYGIAAVDVTHKADDKPLGFEVVRSIETTSKSGPVPEEAAGQDHAKYVEEFQRLVKLLEANRCSKCHQPPSKETGASNSSNVRPGAPTTSAEAHGMIDRLHLDILGRRATEARYWKERLDQSDNYDEWLWLFLRAAGDGS